MIVISTLILFPKLIVIALLLEYEIMSANSVFPTISQEQSGDRKSSL